MLKLGKQLLILFQLKFRYFGVNCIVTLLFKIVFRYYVWTKYVIVSWWWIHYQR